MQCVGRILRLGLTTLLVATGVAPLGRSVVAAGLARSADRHGSLTVGVAQDQYVLRGPDVNLGMYPLNTNIFETLTYLAPNYQVKPMLAVRWKFMGRNTWRFFLRRGVRFQNGAPFNARAVKIGLFDRVAKTSGGGTISAGPKSARIVNNYTIDFTPTTRDLRIPEQLVHPLNGVVAPGTNQTRRPVGTGPFRFVEYRQSERIVVARNPLYWGRKAKLNRITFRFYPDATSRRQALQAGEVDLIVEVSRPDVRALRSGFTIKTSSVGAYEAMYANIHGKAPYDILRDRRVRQAVAYAIDRRLMVKNLLFGLATTDQTMVPPSILQPFRSMVTGYPFDPGKAQALLEAAGWKVGKGGIRRKGNRPLRLTLVSGFPSAEVHRPIPVFLQAEFKRIGIDLRIVERPDSNSYTAVMDSGQGDLFLEQGNQNDGNPGFLPVLLFYSAGTGEAPSYQKLFAPGRPFDRLVVPSLTAVNPRVVRRSVARGMDYLVDKQAIVIDLAGLYQIYGMKRSVRGFVPHPSFLSTRWNTVSVAG